MKLRSLLFVPGDRPDRMEKALAAGADALILDLEDSVAAPAKPEARRAVAAFLDANAAAPLWVRINPLDGPEADRDLAAILPHHPNGIVLPKAEGGASVEELARRLTERGNVASQILAIATETPAAMFQLGTYGGVKRLAGLTWGAEDLSAAIGASRKRDPQGRWTDTFRFVRAQVLLTAHARGVMAVDTLHADFRDLDGLHHIAAESYADGFSGMLAIHPSQVAVINAAFTPGEAEIAHARAIVNAFSANPSAGALQLDGKMIDQPHLEQARKLLERLR